jgi:2-methylcitrate dehydratase PrpD
VAPHVARRQIIDAINTTAAALPHAARLIERLLSLGRAPLPAELANSARLALLDCLGCAFFGTQFDWARIAADLALEGHSTAAGAVTLVGRGRAPAVAAALANGTAIHSFELDDVILGSLTHAGAAVIPAALAAAELSGASGERLLAAIVAGYELDARLGAALGTEPIARGFHTTSVAGPLAAALAACVVSGATAEVTASALGIAISMSSGLKAFQQGTGGMVKRLHGGLGASNGLLAWQLASRGFDGPHEAIEGKFGLMEVFAKDGGRAELLSRGLGDDWAIGRNWVKMFPCCALIHTAAEAVETLRAEARLAPADVRAIRVGTSGRCVIQNGERNPREPMAAQYSIPFNAALAMVADARDPNAFLPPLLNDARIRDMIGCVELTVDAEVDKAYPDLFGAKVEIETTDGRKFQRTSWNAHGTPADPCSADEIRAKFRKLASACVSEETAEAIVQAVEALADRGSVRALVAALQQGQAS